MKTMKCTCKTKTSEFRDQTGDLENGYLKNANFSCVNTEKWIHTFDTDVPIILSRNVSKIFTSTSINTKLHFYSTLC